VRAGGAGGVLGGDRGTIRCEVEKSGAVVAATVSRPGEEPRRAPRIQPYKEEPVTFSNGDVRLAGMLLLPAGPGPHPALVFVHGSGQGTRGQYPAEADRF